IKKTKYRRVDVSMFGEETRMADINLIVDGTSIPVIKSVLSIASPVFRAMFQQDFRERDQKTISLPGKKLDNVLMLLKCIIISGYFAGKSVAFSVLPLTDEYQMMSLKTKCENSLLNTLFRIFDEFYMKDCSYLYKCLSIAVKFSLQRLTQHCVSLAADFRQKDRKNTMLGQNIPAYVVTQIDDMVIARLEVRHDDVTAMVLVRTGYSTEEYVIRSFLNESEKGNPIDDHMRALRLAYSLGRSCTDLKILAVAKIQIDKESEHWCHDMEYNVLPENIKRAIQIAPPQKND
ncbi:TDP1L-like protein, partial [Mya arenaria]